MTNQYLNSILLNKWQIFLKKNPQIKKKFQLHYEKFKIFGGLNFLLKSLFKNKNEHFYFYLLKPIEQRIYIAIVDKKLKNNKVYNKLDSFEEKIQKFNFYKS